MQDFKLYEYAVIRALPRVEREEFFNVGLILFSKKEKYIRAAFSVDQRKLLHFFPSDALEDLEHHLQSFKKTVAGDLNSTGIAGLEIPERFRWLTAVRSSCVQTSRPHAGLSKDLDATFERLFQQLVL